MATSRTGTTKYLRNRDRVLRAARASGLTRCPGYDDVRGVHHPCGVVLDYDTPGLDASAETDHIVQPRYTGGVPDDSVDNLRVLCRGCNRGREKVRPPAPDPGAEAFPLLGSW